MALFRCNISSKEYNTSTVLPRDSNRAYLCIQAIVGVIHISIGNNFGALRIKAGESFNPIIVPTSEIRISGGTFVVLTNGLPPSISSEELMGYSIEDDFIDFTTQTTVGLDTPTTAKLGPPKTSPNNLVSVDNMGVITILQAGKYAIKTRQRFGRTTGTGVSRIFGWVEQSLDGGETWLTSGNTIEVNLDAADETDVFFDTAFIQVSAGIKFRSRWARSSTGTNDGNLLPAIPSATLQALGLVGAPSSQMTFYKEV